MRKHKVMEVRRIGLNFRSQNHDLMITVSIWIFNGVSEVGSYDISVEQHYQ
jgi:hypothetical protein